MHTQDTQNNPNVPLVGSDVDSFLRFIKHRRSGAKSTINTYRPIVRDFLEWLGDKPLELQLINVYADILSLRGYAPKTYRNRLAIIRSYINYLYINDLTSIKPQKVLLPKEQETEAVYLTAEELTRLLKVVKNLRDKAMVLVLATSGVRVSEFVNLKYEDLMNNSIIVRRGKGNKTRLVFISEQAKRYLNRYIDNERGTDYGYLFPGPLGGSLSRQIVSRKIKQYAKKACINKDVSVHTLRHTMATQMLLNGSRLEEVQVILGHKKLQTTMIYLHFSNNHLRESYAQSLNAKVY